MNETETVNNETAVKTDAKKAYLIWGIAALLAMLLYLILLKAFGAGGKEFLRHLSDACFVVGGLMTCCGALGAVGKNGGYDAFGYGVKTLAEVFKRDAWKEKPETYSDYKERKTQKRKGRRYPMLAVGVAILVIGLIVTFIYGRTTA